MKVKSDTIQASLFTLTRRVSLVQTALFKHSTFDPAARTYDNLDACEVVRSSHLTTAATLLEVTSITPWSSLSQYLNKYTKN